MCKVKEGSEVTTIADLQNLVTSVILRQTSNFSSEEIFNNIQDKIIGSKFETLENEVYSRCVDTISSLYLIDCLRSTEDNRYKLTMNFPST